jgi:hypothetical protein
LILSSRSLRHALEVLNAKTKSICKWTFLVGSVFKLLPVALFHDVECNQWAVRVGKRQKGSETMHLKGRCLHKRINSCVELKVGVRLVIVDGGGGGFCSSLALFRNCSLKWHRLMQPTMHWGVGGGGGD